VGGQPVKKLTIKNARGVSQSKSLGSVLYDADKWPIDLARPSPAADSAFSTNALQTLIRAVRAILSIPPEPTPESLQGLYSLCEGIVSGSGSVVAQTLYDRIRIEVERKVGDSASFLRGLDTTDGEAWLGELEWIWKAFNGQMVRYVFPSLPLLQTTDGFAMQKLMVRSIFLHLDRTFVLQTPGLLSLW